MNRHMSQWGLLAAFAAILVIAGCSSKKTETDTSTSTQAEPQATTPAAESENGETAEAVVPAGTVGEIWTQISAEQSKLSGVIQNGDLKDVHKHAFAIRDLVVALADKANAASPAGAAKLNGLVGQVKASADKLDEVGDAGNLSGTQAEYAKLETTLGAIKVAVGGK